MKWFVIIALTLVLPGCNSSKMFITVEKPMVVMPTSEMFICPDTVVIPDINTLTDIQVAQVLIELKQDLEICRNKIKNLEIFLTEAKKRLEK